MKQQVKDRGFGGGGGGGRGMARRVARQWPRLRGPA